MSDEGKARGWWHTLPGLITAITAVITAVTGLVVAINQTGWFEGQGPPATTKSPVPGQSAPPGAAVPMVPAPAPSPTAPPSATYALALPAMRDYRLGAATFTVLRAEVSPWTTEKDGLQVRLRMTNHHPYDANFWDRSFRLIVGGVPMAPEGGLNELVPGQSAKEGNILFVIPRGVAGATLKIAHGGESTDIPLALTPPR